MPALPYEPVACSTCMRIANETMPLGNRAMSCAAMIRPTPGVLSRSLYPADATRYKNTVSLVQFGERTLKWGAKNVLRKCADYSSRNGAVCNTPRHADERSPQQIISCERRISTSLWMDSFLPPKKRENTRLLTVL